MSMDRADRQALLAVFNKLCLEYCLCVWLNGVVGRVLVREAELPIKASLFCLFKTGEAEETVDICWTGC